MTVQYMPGRRLLVGCMPCNLPFLCGRQVYYGTWRNTAVAIKVLNAQAADSGKLMAEL